MRNLQIAVVLLGLSVSAIFALALVDTPVHGQTREDHYPRASYPKLRFPKTVAEVMPYARLAARNPNGFLGRGFGVVRPGEKIILVTRTIDAGSEIYVEAIMAALRERKVIPIRMRETDIAGVTLQEAREYQAYLDKVGAGSDDPNKNGWIDGCIPFLPNDFLQKTRPDLYELCKPQVIGEALHDWQWHPPVPAHLQAVAEKMRRLHWANTYVGPYLNRIMDKDPSIRGVFYGWGGPVWEPFAPHKERWLGLFLFDNPWEVVSPKQKFPADVWMQSEELTMEPLASTDKVTITDPEGTNVWWDMTEEQAQRWAKGVYLRGHLFMFPQEAYGSYGLNVLNYPSNVPEYIPASPIVELNGTIASTSCFNGFFPRLVETWENGYLTKAEGGGIYGELLRTLMKMPGINEKTWPYYDHPGYLWHYETALGTNPKVIRPDSRKYPIAADRERDGVMHWGLGAQLWHDPGNPGGGPTPSAIKFEKENKLPALYHAFHLRTYFNTMRVRLRGAKDKWVTLVDRGRSTSLDSPEVRALASRYGDPNEVLATEWIADIPGISAPGSYQEYARDPYQYDKTVFNRIEAGTYDGYHPYVRPPAK